MKKILIVFVLFLTGIIAFSLWWVNGTSAVDKDNTENQTFVVPPGAGVKQIASDLKEQQLIKDQTIFYLMVKQMGIEKKIQAGSYQLSPSQSAGEIATNLTMGTEDLWITIPEGKRATEVAEILRDMDGYDETWETELIRHEGYLFPDTYLFPKDATIALIIDTMRNTFDQKYAELKNNDRRPQEDVVILASLIQREAITDEEMPIIAGIIENRLDEGMPLQIDATIQYAKGTSGAWWKPVLLSEYQSVQSPYNTYLIQGLPPGPIANPGEKALEAVLNPEESEYFYYLHDSDGVIRYAKTLNQHNANIRRYGL